MREDPATMKQADAAPRRKLPVEIAKLKKRRPNIGTWAAMQFLNARDPATIKIIKGVMIDFGFRAQRFANKVWGRTPFVQSKVKHPPATVGKAPLKAQVIHFINKPMPGGLPKRTSRALLDIEDDKVIPIIRAERCLVELTHQVLLKRFLCGDGIEEELPLLFFVLGASAVTTRLRHVITPFVIELRRWSVSVQHRQA